ncbi:MAG: hypothetical protein JJ895_09140 [Balneolaceae bacterium]|nr:hypothetical protein [Balneolaceae bacterium]
MNHLRKTILIGLLSILFAPTLSAQNIDANRMNRDIRIMENILSELFRTQIETPTAETLIIDRGGFRMRGIRGTYLNGYGIIFMINREDPFAPKMHVTGQGSYSFFYSTDSETGDASKEVDETTIKRRITEFLMDYASTIGQLEDDEEVMVIYGANTGGSGSLARYRVALNGNFVDEEPAKALPVISGSVTVKDLKEYRRGGLNEAKMKEKISFASSEGKEYMDLKVMGNIFETAFDESDNGFRMSGKPNYLLLDNFGAIFSFDTRYSDRDGVFRVLNNSRIVLQNMRRDQQRATSVSGNNLSEEELEAAQEEIKTKIIEGYADMMSNVSEYLVDYGRTLSSVDSDQHILISMKVSASGIEEVPERVDVQIKKSVLESLDRGRISRDDAIKSVSVTEY